jgi:drug/metabolite transporter superfamily protein YnfA
MDFIMFVRGGVLEVSAGERSEGYVRRLAYGGIHVFISLTWDQLDHIGGGCACFLSTSL